MRIDEENMKTMFMNMVFKKKTFKKTQIQKTFFKFVYFQMGRNLGGPNIMRPYNCST